MIQRFYFVKLRDDETPNRLELSARLRAELAEAGADATVGVPADDSAARWDLALVITAATLDAWTALALTPAMIVVLGDLAARAVVVKAWTFES